MSDPIVKLTEQQRIEANRWHNDPEGWRSAQSMAEHKVRETMRAFTYAVEIAKRNPYDEDCRAFLRAINVAVVSCDA